MKMKITVYKDSGKFYTSEVIESKEDLPMWDDEFIEFIKENNPANIGEGYLVIDDADDNQLFHNALYRYSDIY